MPAMLVQAASNSRLTTAINTSRGLENWSWSMAMPVAADSTSRVSAARFGATFTN